ncbi:MAG: DUF134 domain-containing protein [Candidatus Lokiarchaeota archaeon]|nr:DUF134 domain-containing protein [Candidatus Lokiarchaeota archaeon]
MGRQTSMRYVKNPPSNFYFPSESKDPTVDNFIGLTVAEFEAMRLKHYISLNQKDSAENMSVSQPTFSRILDKAHQKITQALIEGKDIRVYGGNINLKKGFKGYGCLNCDEEWKDELAAKERSVYCPNCNSEKVYYLVREPL